MDKKIIFVKTSKGEDEFKSKTSHLSGDFKRALGLVDDKSTVGELTKRAAPSLRASLDDMLQELANSGFIKDKDKGKESSALKVATPKMSTPKMAMPAAQSKDSGDELDFTSVIPAMNKEALAAEEGEAKAQDQASRAEWEEKEQARAQADAKLKQAAEARARAEAETFRLKAEREAAKVMAELGSAQARGKEEAEAKARVEAEAARLKAEQEEVKAKAELAAAQARAEEEAEAKARAEAETARLRAEREAAKTKEELAAAQAKEYEVAESKAGAEAARFKEEQEEAKILAERAAVQAREKAEAEAQARVQAALASLRPETEAIQIKPKEEAEARSRAEAETARLKAEQEEAKQLAKLAAGLAKTKTEAEAEAKTHAAAAAKTSPQSRVEPHLQGPLDSAQKARADEEARQLTESQARIWAQAEQRAKMQAQQAEAMQKMAHKAEKISPAKAVPRIAKEPGEPIPWGKISAGLLGLTVVLAVLLPYVWPMQDYIAQIQQRLSAQLHQPVHIGHMRPSLLPLPKLELQNVSVGSGQELKAGSVILNFNIVALFTDTKAIDRVEIGELVVRAESFDKALSWLQAAGGDANYPVVQIVLQRARVSGEELNLPAVNGVVDFDGHGRLVKTVLNSEDGKLTVELQPQQSRWQIVLAIKERILPLMPGIMFDELIVKGLASAGEANFSVIEGRLYKGKLLGSARLTWRNGWQMQGQLNVKTLSLQDALPQLGMTGDMDGNASFTLRAAQLPLLAKAPHLDGRLSVKKGYISSIDMVETARVANRQSSASAGRTNFDELSGALVVDGNTQQLHQIKISAGVMSANGFVDVVSGKQLSGRLNVDLKIRAEMGSMPLTLSGTVAEPVWRTGH